jgi:hypothetical protein
MTRPEQTWWEKRLAKEEDDSSGKEASKVTRARGEDNPGSSDGNPESGNYNLQSGNCHPESGNRNLDSGNNNSVKENDRQGEVPVPMEVNMVFRIPTEFCAPMDDVVELALRAEHAVFEKPEISGTHMKPIFIRGHLLVDGGASINILPLLLFKKFSHVKDLKCTNLSLSSFAGDLTEANGIIYKVLMGSHFFCMYGNDAVEHGVTLLLRVWPINIEL